MPKEDRVGFNDAMISAQTVTTFDPLSVQGHDEAAQPGPVPLKPETA